MEIKAIDVSSHQSKPDWAKVANSGIKMAILRIHQKYGIDASFEYNYKNARANGILVGGYKYSYALTVKDSEKEADDTLAVLNGRKLDCPLFLDLEWEKQHNLSNKLVEQIALAFLNKIEKAGYMVGIYCNTYWYDTKISKNLKKYPFWLASYPNKDTGKIVERLRPGVGIGWQYSEHGKVPGIEGSDTDLDIFYTDFQIEEVKAATTDTTALMKGVTAKDILDKARSWIGRNEKAGTHKYIIDLYNSYKPLARGYAVQYNDQWCDTCLSALFIALNAVYLIGGTECGVEEHVKIFKNKGIWIEDGSIIPGIGYIIVYNWDDTTQPNDGYSDHIGIVESVDMNSRTITCIEGNYKDAVSRRTIPIGWGYIRGYAAPDYADVSEKQEKEKEAAKKEVQTETKPSGGISREPKWVGAATVSDLNVRVWAGFEYSNIQSYPRLNKDNLVDVCDTVTDSDGIDWYYVRIAGKYYGFVKAEFIRRV